MCVLLLKNTATAYSYEISPGCHTSICNRPSRSDIEIFVYSVVFPSLDIYVCVCVSCVAGLSGALSLSASFLLFPTFPALTQILETVAITHEQLGSLGERLVGPFLHYNSGLERDGVGLGGGYVRTCP